jgi:hypothetical protein
MARRARKRSAKSTSGREPSEAPQTSSKKPGKQPGFFCGINQPRIPEAYPVRAAFQ